MSSSARSSSRDSLADYALQELADCDNFDEALRELHAAEERTIGEIQRLRD